MLINEHSHTAGRVEAHWGAECSSFFDGASILHFLSQFFFSDNQLKWPCESMWNWICLPCDDPLSLCHMFRCSNWFEVHPMAASGILVLRLLITALGNWKRTERFENYKHLQICLPMWGYILGSVCEWCNKNTRSNSININYQSQHIMDPLLPLNSHTPCLFLAETAVRPCVSYLMLFNLCIENIILLS